MRIKKQPIFEEITCAKCGTVFVPDAYDNITCTGEGVLEIDCPTCGTFHRCKTIGYEY